MLCFSNCSFRLGVADATHHTYIARRAAMQLCYERVQGRPFSAGGVGSYFFTVQCITIYNVYGCSYGWWYQGTRCR